MINIYSICKGVFIPIEEFLNEDDAKKALKTLDNPEGFEICKHSVYESFEEWYEELMNKEVIK